MLSIACHWKTALLALTLALTTMACPGDGVAVRDVAVKGDTKSSEQAVGQCSASGIAASCDPIGATGCDKGDCYVTAGVGVSCVCPAGSAKAGEPCNSTPDCAPGNVCAGTKAPGVCRSTCAPIGPVCDTGLKCTFIDDFPNFGYCEPK